MTQIEERRTIRPCGTQDIDRMLEIINAAAQAYRPVIPPDRWHDPYMPAAELADELAAGVVFSGCEIDGALVGVMGLQAVRDVDLIRHAYVQPNHQGQGIGAVLLDHLKARATRPILIGTWATADWAIRFYERHGFRLVPPARKADLLRAYWTVPERQIETSVVLERAPGGA